MGFVSPLATEIACHLAASPHLPRLFAEFAPDAYQGGYALETLVERWPGDPGTFDLVRALAALPESATRQERDRRGQAAAQLVKHWPEHPDARSLRERQNGSGTKEDPRLVAERLFPEQLPPPSDSLRASLTQALATENPGVRGEVLELVGKRLRDHPEALALLRHHASQDAHYWVREQAMRVLAQRWPQAEGTRTLLVACAANDPHPRARRRAISSLHRIVDVDPQARDALHLLTGHDDAEVRTAALTALFHSSDVSSNLLETVFRHASDDPHPMVRDMGALFLVRHIQDQPPHRRDHPRTKRLLQNHCLEMARSAEPGWMPLTGIDRLVDLWPEDPELWDVVRECAAPAPDPVHMDRHWRMGALELLAAYWPGDVEARERLTASAAGDPDGEVRVAAERAGIVARRMNEASQNSG